MAANSSIEWTESTWNPVTGCTKISPGCKNCYAEKFSKRLKAMGQPSYQNGFDLTVHDHLTDLPLKIKKPSLFFVNSMSDLFHQDVPISFIQKIFETMEEAYWHTFQVLTKRSERLLNISNQLRWPKNIWMGVSVENIDYAYRIDDLKRTNAYIKFISFEPLIDACKVNNLDGVNWAIVGGESGPGARPMRKEWVIEIRNICQDSNVPFFFKQWGGTNKKKAGRLLDGKIWDEMPKIKAI